MTTQLEQKFYKTFEIKHATIQQYGASYFLNTIEIDGERYTPIDDRKLLEMICICNSTYINGYTNYFTATGKTKEELKEEILKKCIVLSKDIKNKIQQLFEGEQ